MTPDEPAVELDVPPARRMADAQRANLKESVLRSISQTHSPARYVRLGGSPSYRRLVPVLIAVALVMFAAGSLTTAYATNDQSSPTASKQSLESISTQGTAVSVTAQSLRTGPPRDPGLPVPKGPVYLLGTRGTTSFFSVPSKSGDTCYYTGVSTTGDTYDLRAGSCWTPSPRFPLHDMSQIQASGPGGFQVLNIYGIAADGVSTVAVVDLDGNIVAQTAVTDNVYRVTAYPPGGVSALLALDAGDHVLQRVSYAR